jgi:uncharacterized protein
LQYRRFGRTELSLSNFSLGTMRCLSSPQVFYQTVNRAIELGINHLETAPSYGRSEEYLGLAFQRGIPRESVYVTTKVLPTIDSTLSSVDAEILASCQRLQTDYIDCVAIHGINTPEHLTKSIEYIVPELQKLVCQGVIGHIGFSTHGSLELVLQAIQTGLFEFVNLHYYYFFQRLAPAIAAAQTQDMGVFIISPGDKGGQLFTPAAKLVELCQPYQPLNLTYRWLLQDLRVTTLSVGAAVPEELDLPVGITSDALSWGELEVIDRLQAHLAKTLDTDFCSQCHACLPCPEDINIPEILRLRNLAVGYEMVDYGKYRYRMLENAGHWFPGKRGHHCTECGDCLPRCPQQLKIPELLFDADDRLKSGNGRRLWEN